MKKLIAITGLGLLLAGCAREGYQGGGWNSEETGPTGRTGQWNTGTDNKTGVLSNPSSLGGRTHDPFWGSVGGQGQGPDVSDRGAIEERNRVRDLDEPRPITPGEPDNSP